MLMGRMATPCECIVDSDGFNALVLKQAVFDRVCSAVSDGRLTLWCSRVTLAEVADTPDETERAALLRLPVSPVTPLGVLGGDPLGAS
jgi:hypothetical protein